jgi:hypothetical protein
MNNKKYWACEIRQDPKTKKTNITSVLRPVANGLLLRISPLAAPVDVREMLLLTPEHGTEPWDGDKQFIFDFRKLKRTAGKPNEFFKTFAYRRNRKKYDKDLVATATFAVNEPRAGFMHQRWETIVDVPSLDRQLSAGQHVAAEMMKLKFPKGLPEKPTYEEHVEYGWIRTALGMPQHPEKDEKPVESWSYCAYCGNAKVPDRAHPCGACATVLHRDLSLAWEVYKTLQDERRQCCGGLSTDKSHLYFHGRDWNCVYEGTGVDMGANLYEDHAMTYWVFDNDSTTESFEYGAPIKYYDPEFWAKLDHQLDEAAEVAWNSDICSCEHCGYHYHVGNGPCGCSASESDNENQGGNA